MVNILNNRHDWDKLKSMLSFQLKQVWGGMLACNLMYVVYVLRRMLASSFLYFVLVHVSCNLSKFIILTP